MTWLDRYGQRLRLKKTRPYIRPGARVLDIGCGDGALFRSLDAAISSGVGIDPDALDSDDGRFRFVRGYYPNDYEHVGDLFDAIVGLAVLEHLTADQQSAMAAACFRHLKPQGRLVLTVPSRLVDPILHIVQRIGLGDRDTMHLEEHHGFHAGDTGPLFEAAGFTLAARRHFELFLNNVFAFTKGAR
ncbi:MAG TPA: class I SAM-dependent methyltransferase [Candidatus Dormibacteraeota bacterium]